MRPPGLLANRGDVPRRQSIADEIGVANPLRFGKLVAFLKLNSMLLPCHRLRRAVALPVDQSLR